jgi:aminoglycoside phosphotransferase (APT) family kinase protein
VHIERLQRPPDDFQQPPSDAEIRCWADRLAGVAGPEWTAREIGGGMFNTTFGLLHRGVPRYALRFSPPADHPLLFSNERQLLRREHAIGPWVAPVARWLPCVRATDFTHQLAPRDAVLSDWIAGENWDAVKSGMTEEQNAVLWRELAGLLRTVHEVQAPSFGWPHPEARFDTWSAFLLNTARGLLEDFPRLGVEGKEPRDWVRVLEEGTPLLDEVRTPRVVHGDPWPKNVLIDRTGVQPRIVGLIDHERGLFGDPWNEWVFHFLDFPPAFWEAYGPRPTGPGADFRAGAYRGLIQTQVLLEGRRYRFDTAAVRSHLTDVTQRMREALARA